MKSISISTEKAVALLEAKKYSSLRIILNAMEPADIAEFMEEVPKEQYPLVFRILPKELAADVFVEMDPDQQELLISGFSDNELREVLDRVDVVVRRRGDEGRARLRVTELADEGVDLVRGELSALARLRALGELDLEVLCRAQVLDRDAEASRRDLLDSAVGVGAETFGVESAFAGIGHRADRVECSGYRFVGFGREGSEGHRAADEVLHDRLDRLNLVNRDRRRGLEGELRAERDLMLGGIVDLGRVLLEERVVARTDGLPEVRDVLGRPEVVFAALADAVLAARRKHRTVAVPSDRRGNR